MSADFIPLDVLWAKFLPSDIKMWKIKRSEFDAIEQVVNEVAATECFRAHAAVSAIKCCDSVWYRIKLTEPSQLRVIFSIERDGRVLLVHAIMRRTENTYGMVETLYEIAEAKAA